MLLIYLLTLALHILLQFGSDFYKRAIENISWVLKVSRTGVTVVRLHQEQYDGERIPQHRHEV